MNMQQQIGHHDQFPIMDNQIRILFQLYVKLLFVRIIKEMQ